MPLPQQLNMTTTCVGSVDGEAMIQIWHVEVAPAKIKSSLTSGNAMSRGLATLAISLIDTPPDGSPATLTAQSRRMPAPHCVTTAMAAISTIASAHPHCAYAWIYESIGGDGVRSEQRSSRSIHACACAHRDVTHTGAYPRHR